MADATYVGESIRLEITIEDRDGEVFDPDVVVISAVAPDGDITSHSTEDVDPTIFNTATGVYSTYFNADQAGAWVIRVEIQYSENEETVIERKTARRAVYTWPE